MKWGLWRLEALWLDVRYGVRMSLANPGFTLIAVITLALGIAANTTIFSLADALILRPFDFPRQEQLVMVWEHNLQTGIDHSPVAPGNFIDWRQQSQSFERLVTFTPQLFDLTEADQPERLEGYQVSAEFFDVLGVKSVLGRTFLPGEDEPGRNQVVVIKDSLWRRRFGADPNIVSRLLTLDGKKLTVIGVIPAGFNFPSSAGEIWAPLALDDKAKSDRTAHYLQVVGLLRPGGSVAQAGAELDIILQRSQQESPETGAGYAAQVVAMNEDFARFSKIYVSVLMGVVAFVLLIGCANVANMLISRALVRRKEIAVRLALGASRWRLVRQMLTESLLLAFAGGAVGVGLSWLAVALLRRSIPEDFAKFIPGFEHFAINRATLLFTLAVSMLSSLIFGLLPAWQATRPNLSRTLRQDGGGGRSSISGYWLRPTLVVVEIALSLVLLVGAGLMIRSFVTMMQEDLGFDPHKVLSFQISLPEGKYPEERRRNFYHELLKQVESLPGVVAAGATSSLPMNDGGNKITFEIAGRAPFAKDEVPMADVCAVTPGYFKAVGLRVQRGRDFTAQDNDRAQRVALVNETFVRRFFPNEEVIGHRITRSDAGTRPLEIIGVVGDIKNNGLDAAPDPSFYVPYAQDSHSDMGIFVRTIADPASVAAAVRNQVVNLDPTRPIFNLKTIERMIHERTSPKRIMTVVMSVLAMVALLLAGVGLYAVIAYAVSQRTYEIGIRLALGAQPRNILRLIVMQGGGLTLIGLALGLAGALALTRVISPLLYGITAVDPLTFILISLLLLCVTLLACWVPARRATRVDPMLALRCE
jgi:putative ABC transport system permease protein